MFNKCSKCGKLLTGIDQRKLVLNTVGGVSTLCLECYEERHSK